MEDYIRTSRGTVLLSEAARRNQRLLDLFKIGNDKHLRRTDSSSKYAKPRRGEASDRRNVTARPKSLYDFRVRYDLDAIMTSKTTEFHDKVFDNEPDRRDLRRREPRTVFTEHGEYGAETKDGNIGLRRKKSKSKIDLTAKDEKSFFEVPINYSRSKATNRGELNETEHRSEKRNQESTAIEKSKPIPSNKEIFENIEYKDSVKSRLQNCLEPREEYRRSVVPGFSHSSDLCTLNEHNEMKQSELGSERRKGNIDRIATEVKKKGTETDKYSELDASDVFQKEKQKSLDNYLSRSEFENDLENRPPKGSLDGPRSDIWYGGRRVSNRKKQGIENSKFEKVGARSSIDAASGDDVKVARRRKSEKCLGDDDMQFIDNLLAELRNFNADPPSESVETPKCSELKRSENQELNNSRICIDGNNSKLDEMHSIETSMDFDKKWDQIPGDNDIQTRKRKERRRDKSIGSKMVDSCDNETEIIDDMNQHGSNDHSCAKEQRYCKNDVKFRYNESVIDNVDGKHHKEKNFMEPREIKTVSMKTDVGMPCELAQVEDKSFIGWETMHHTVSSEIDSVTHKENKSSEELAIEETVGMKDAMFLKESFSGALKTGAKIAATCPEKSIPQNTRDVYDIVLFQSNNLINTAANEDQIIKRQGSDKNSVVVEKDDWLNMAACLSHNGTGIATIQANSGAETVTLPAKDNIEASINADRGNNRDITCSNIDDAHFVIVQKTNNEIETKYKESAKTTAAKSQMANEEEIITKTIRNVSNTGDYRSRGITSKEQSDFNASIVRKGYKEQLIVSSRVDDASREIRSSIRDDTVATVRTAVKGTFCGLEEIDCLDRVRSVMSEDVPTPLQMSDKAYDEQSHVSNNKEIAVSADANVMNDTSEVNSAEYISYQSTDKQDSAIVQGDSPTEANASYKGLQTALRPECYSSIDFNSEANSKSSDGLPCPKGLRSDTLSEHGSFIMDNATRSEIRPNATRSGDDVTNIGTSASNKLRDSRQGVHQSASRYLGSFKRESSRDFDSAQQDTAIDQACTTDNACCGTERVNVEIGENDSQDANVESHDMLRDKTVHRAQNSPDRIDILGTVTSDDIGDGMSSSIISVKHEASLGKNVSDHTPDVRGDSSSNIAYSLKGMRDEVSGVEKEVPIGIVGPKSPSDAQIATEGISDIMHNVALSDQDKTLRDVNDQSQSGIRIVLEDNHPPVALEKSQPTVERDSNTMQSSVYIYEIEDNVGQSIKSSPNNDRIDPLANEGCSSITSIPIKTSDDEPREDRIKATARMVNELKEQDILNSFDERFARLYWKIKQFSLDSLKNKGDKRQRPISLGISLDTEILAEKYRRQHSPSKWKSKERELLSSPKLKDSCAILQSKVGKTWNFESLTKKNIRDSDASDEADSIRGVLGNKELLQEKSRKIARSCEEKENVDSLKDLDTFPKKTCSIENEDLQDYEASSEYTSKTCSRRSRISKNNESINGKEVDEVDQESSTERDKDVSTDDAERNPLRSINWTGIQRHLAATGKEPFNDIVTQDNCDKELKYEDSNGCFRKYRRRKSLMLEDNDKKLHAVNCGESNVNEDMHQEHYIICSQDMRESNLKERRGKILNAEIDTDESDNTNVACSTFGIGRQRESPRSKERNSRDDQSTGDTLITEKEAKCNKVQKANDMEKDDMIRCNSDIIDKEEAADCEEPTEGYRRRFRASNYAEIRDGVEDRKDDKQGFNVGRDEKAKFDDQEKSKVGDSVSCHQRRRLRRSRSLDGDIEDEQKKVVGGSTNEVSNEDIREIKRNVFDSIEATESHRRRLRRSKVFDKIGIEDEQKKEDYESNNEINNQTIIEAEKNMFGIIETTESYRRRLRRSKVFDETDAEDRRIKEDNESTNEVNNENIIGAEQNVFDSIEKTESYRRRLRRSKVFDEISIDHGHKIEDNESTDEVSNDNTRETEQNVFDSMETTESYRRRLRRSTVFDETDTEDRHKKEYNESINVVSNKNITQVEQNVFDSIETTESYRRRLRKSEVFDEEDIEGRQIKEDNESTNKVSDENIRETEQNVFNSREATESYRRRLRKSKIFDEEDIEDRQTKEDNEPTNEVSNKNVIEAEKNALDSIETTESYRRRLRRSKVFDKTGTEDEQNKEDSESTDKVSNENVREAEQTVLDSIEKTESYKRRLRRSRIFEISTEDVQEKVGHGSTYGVGIESIESQRKQIRKLNVFELDTEVEQEKVNKRHNFEANDKNIKENELDTFDSIEPSESYRRRLRRSPFFETDPVDDKLKDERQETCQDNNNIVKVHKLEGVENEKLPESYRRRFRRSIYFEAENECLNSDAKELKQRDETHETCKDNSGSRKIYETDCLEDEESNKDYTRRFRGLIQLEQSAENKLREEETQETDVFCNENIASYELKSKYSAESAEGSRRLFRRSKCFDSNAEEEQNIDKEVNMIGEENKNEQCKADGVPRGGNGETIVCKEYSQSRRFNLDAKDDVENITKGGLSSNNNEKSMKGGDAESYVSNMEGHTSRRSNRKSDYIETNAENGTREQDRKENNIVGNRDMKGNEKPASDDGKISEEKEIRVGRSRYLVTSSEDEKGKEEINSSMVDKGAIIQERLGADEEELTKYHRGKSRDFDATVGEQVSCVAKEGSFKEERRLMYFKTGGGEDHEDNSKEIFTSEKVEDVEQNDIEVHVNKGADESIYFQNRTPRNFDVTTESSKEKEEGGDFHVALDDTIGKELEINYEGLYQRNDTEETENNKAKLHDEENILSTQVNRIDESDFNQGNESSGNAHSKATTGDDCKIPVLSNLPDFKRSDTKAIEIHLETATIPSYRVTSLMEKTDERTADSENAPCTDQRLVNDDQDEFAGYKQSVCQDNGRKSIFEEVAVDSCSPVSAVISTVTTTAEGAEKQDQGLEQKKLADSKIIKDEAAGSIIVKPHIERTNINVKELEHDAAGTIDKKIADTDIDSSEGYYINYIGDSLNGSVRRGEYVTFERNESRDSYATMQTNPAGDVDSLRSKMHKIKAKMRQLVDRNIEMEERIDFCEDKQWQYFLKHNKLLQLAVSKLWQKEGFDSSRLIQEEENNVYMTGYDLYRKR